MNAKPAGPVRLPYPHARNDCVACRERDADVLLPDESTPAKRPCQLCQGCLGTHLALKALYGAGPGLDGLVTVRLAVAPARRGDGGRRGER
jgi:hypothetical protein